jgi:hypothetical protein
MARLFSFHLALFFGERDWRERAAHPGLDGREQRDREERGDENNGAREKNHGCERETGSERDGAREREIKQIKQNAGVEMEREHPD